jgi:hypothetical protein
VTGGLPDNARFFRSSLFQQWFLYWPDVQTAQSLRLRRPLQQLHPPMGIPERDCKYPGAQSIL